MPNIENILKLAAHIEKLPHTDLEAADGFSMTDWKHHCGTPSCIAGWAAHLSGAHHTLPSEAASDWLGIRFEWAGSLYVPALMRTLAEITPAEAAAALRKVAQAGSDYEKLTVTDLWGSP